MFNARFHRLLAAIGSALAIVGGLTAYIPSAALRSVAVVGGLVMALGADIDKVLKGDGPPTDIGL